MNILNVFIGIMIFVSCIGVLASQIINTTEPALVTEQISVAVQPNTLVQLDNLRVIEILNITNTTNSFIISTGNYSFVNGSYLRILSNGSDYNSDTWDVIYRHNNLKVTGASVLILSLVVIIIMASFIMGLKSDVIGKK